MNGVVLLLLLVVTFCYHSETAAQNDSNTIISTSPVDMMNATISLSISSPINPITATVDMDNAIASGTTSTALIPTAIISTMEVTSHDISSMITPVDVLTLLTDTINGTTMSVPLNPTDTVMMTSLWPLSVNSTLPSITLNIMTTAMSSPVDTTDVSSTIMMTTVVMENSGNIPMMTTIIVTTSNPVPAPSDSKISRDELSTGEIIAIVAGGVTTFLVIFVVVVFCYYWKRCKQKVYVMPKTTFQIMPDGFIHNDNVRTGSHSLLISLRNTFKHKDKEQLEDTKLIVTPL